MRALIQLMDTVHLCARAVHSSFWVCFRSAEALSILG